MSYQIAEDEALGESLRRNAAGWGTNVALGFFLGFAPAVGRFFGIPFDVRHVNGQIYLGPAARSENVDAAAMVDALFNHHIAVNPDPVAVTDWVSGMTDRYALRAFTELA